MFHSVKITTSLWLVISVLRSTIILMKVLGQCPLCVVFASYTYPKLIKHSHTRTTCFLWLWLRPGGILDHSVSHNCFSSTFCLYVLREQPSWAHSKASTLGSGLGMDYITLVCGLAFTVISTDSISFTVLLTIEGLVLANDQSENKLSKIPSKNDSYNNNIYWNWCPTDQ